MWLRLIGSTEFNLRPKIRSAAAKVSIVPTKWTFKDRDQVHPDPATDGEETAWICDFDVDEKTVEQAFGGLAGDRYPYVQIHSATIETDYGTFKKVIPEVPIRKDP